MQTIITKKAVSFVQEGMYQITLSLQYVGDGGQIILDKDYTERYKKGQQIGIVQAAFKEKMQADIRRYKEEQAIFNHAQMDVIISNLNSIVGV